jgi:PPP family 3-phenylpropionic acid transporter
MFPAIGLLMLAAALTACAHPPGGAVALKARPGEALGLARHGPTVRLCLFAFFSHLFLHGPMVLFPVYVTGLGGDETMVRDMWIPMLLIEIPLIRWMGPWTRRLGARSLLMAAVLAGGARWLVCGLTANLPLIFAVQLVHGLVVVGLAIGGPLYMEQAVPEQLRSTAQALYSIFSLGVGASTSAALFGEVLQRAGAGAAYAAGGAGALALGLLLPWLLPAPRPVDSPGAPAPAAVE